MKQVDVDATGTLCPEPVRMLGRAAKANQGRPLTILLTADDPTTTYDIPAWCRMTGAELVSEVSVDGILVFTIRLT